MARADGSLRNLLARLARIDVLVIDDWAMAPLAVPGNLHRLQLFRWRLGWIWWRALSRRSQRSYISMDRLHRLINRWIPLPRVLHPYPMQRFDATHPRREPYA
jgi:hypothetical protein